MGTAIPPQAPKIADPAGAAYLCPAMLPLPEPPGRRLLVCVLDWGLGHATRTSALVRAWTAAGSQVTLAGNGRSLAWLAARFPELPCRELPDYGVRYAPGPLLIPGLAASLPRLAAAIAEEARRVRAWAPEFDAVVSDNRYGARSPSLPSVLLTHQLRLAAPRGLGWGEDLGEWIVARLCRGFDSVWIPDADAPGYAGRLASPHRPDRFPPLRRIGPLSRFSGLPLEPNHPWSGPWETVALVSGPEPARSDFETSLRAELAARPGRHLLVRGRPDLPPAPEAPGPEALCEVPHLPDSALAAALRGAARIVSRGGYSTVLDLAALGRLDGRAEFRPTPGQTEQEYLARHLRERFASPPEPS